jgi:hypothetical protein
MVERRYDVNWASAVCWFSTESVPSGKPLERSSVFAHRCIHV